MPIQRKEIYIYLLGYSSLLQKQSTNVHSLLKSDSIYNSNSNTGYECDITLNYGDNVFI